MGLIVCSEGTMINRSYQDKVILSTSWTRSLLNQAGFSAADLSGGPRCANVSAESSQHHRVGESAKQLKAGIFEFGGAMPLLDLPHDRLRSHNITARPTSLLVANTICQCICYSGLEVPPPRSRHKPVLLIEQHLVLALFIGPFAAPGWRRCAHLESSHG